MASYALVEKSVLVFIGLIHSEIRPGRGKSEPYRWQNTRNELAIHDREHKVNDHGTSGTEDREGFISTLHYNRKKDVTLWQVCTCARQSGPMCPFHPLSVLW